MRLNYLQGGGHDPNVLHKFTEMEYDARFRDNNNQTNRFSQNRPSQNQIGNDYFVNYFIHKVLSLNNQTVEFRNAPIHLINKNNLKFDF